MSHRPEQMASEIRSAVQQLLDRGLSDPRISGMITITSARVTPDFKSAFLTVSVMPEKAQALTIHGLKSAAAHLRRQAGEIVRTRQMPELIFKLDASLKKQAGVMESINRAAEDLERRKGQSPGSGSAYAEGQSPEEPAS